MATPTKTSKGKCKILQFGRKKSWHWPAGKQQVLEHAKLATSQQCRPCRSEESETDFSQRYPDRRQREQNKTHEIPFKCNPKLVFDTRVMKHWSGLSRHALGFQSLEIFRTFCLSRGLDCTISTDLNLSQILWEVKQIRHSLLTGKPNQTPGCSRQGKESFTSSSLEGLPLQYVCFYYKKYCIYWATEVFFCFH